MNTIPKLIKGVSEEPPQKQVVKLVRSAWKDSRGIHMKTELLFLRRKSAGYQLIEEDCDMIGADEVVAQITNIHECKDGVYQVITVNEKRDWESGMVEDYDYKLIPFP